MRPGSRVSYMGHSPRKAALGTYTRSRDLHGFPGHQKRNGCFLSFQVSNSCTMQWTEYFLPKRYDHVLNPVTYGYDFVGKRVLADVTNEGS